MCGSPSTTLRINMSKIGKIPVEIKEGVSVTIEKDKVVTTGPKGTLSFSIPAGIIATVEEGIVRVLPKDKDSDVSHLYGLTRAIITNMVKGVSEGFEKKLELSGVGYRAQAVDRDLTLTVGFSHPVKITAPDGVTFAVKENVISVLGSDKTLVGDVAAKVRSVRPPEPYKGKGIKYVGEHIRRKVGKAAKAVGAK